MLPGPALPRKTLVAERDASQNPRQRENIVYELRALDAFEASLNALSLTGWTLERVPVGGHRLDVEGVRINVRPTVRIRLRKLRGADQVGALLVDVAKGQAPKTDESAARVANAMTHSAIVLHQYVVDTCLRTAQNRHLTTRSYFTHTVSRR